jgi:hypothetical protein
MITTSKDPTLPANSSDRRKRSRHWRTSALAGALFFATPLVVFLRYQSYSLLEPEALASLALLATAGALLGLVLEIFGPLSRAVMYALFITLMVDIQVDSPERLKLLWSVLGGSMVVTLLLRNVLPRLGTSMLVVIFLASCFGPTDRSEVGVDTSIHGSPGNPDLPIIVHLILDEHIGIEGIPAEFDRDGTYARQVRDMYLNHGFQVFGRAYSRYYNTHNAIPNLLNFDAPRTPKEYARLEGANWILEKNRYFEVMTERGYAIHVFQSNYLDVCKENDLGNIEWCWTFDPERLNAIQGTPLDLRRKMRVILGVYARLSSVATWLDAPVQQVTPLATLPVLDFIRDEVSQGQPGTLYFAHLLLPHSPYGLMADCEVRPNPQRWLLSADKNVAPRRNNAASRMQRYPLYLKQLQCVTQRIDAFLKDLESSPYADNMIVLIHGDHGSRLDCGPPTMIHRKELTPSDYTDAFSTLFAIKHPAISPGYDRRMVAIEQLFEVSIRDESIPSGDAWFGEPQVLLLHGSKLNPYPMPVFERSLDSEPAAPRKE